MKSFYELEEYALVKDVPIMQKEGIEYLIDELNKRNKEIAKKHKNGKTIEELADEYYLTGYSIRRIIKKVDL